MRRIIIAIIVMSILLIGLQYIGLQTNTLTGMGIVNKSALHKPTYTNPYINIWNGPHNFTINYSKIPKQLVGKNPVFRTPADLDYDVVRKTTIIRLDPRTCPNDLAYCYQVIDHYQNRTTYGKDYSAISSYVLPTTRVKNFVCVGNDTFCVESATNCFCPSVRVPRPPPLYGDQGTCTQQEHLCMSTYSSFVLCRGNFTSCSEQYITCNCGAGTACPDRFNSCVNNRNQLTACKGALADCVKIYKTCYCGLEALNLQKGCTQDINECVKNNRTVVCNGPFETCAKHLDKCHCGKK